MRSVFLRRGDEIWHKHGHVSANEAAKGLAIERQATQIELVLDAVRQLAITAARKYQDEVGILDKNINTLRFSKPFYFMKQIFPFKN